MRIIDEIPHPSLKISVFRMDNRLSVKFENALYEQTFKFGLGDVIDSPQKVRELVDARFIQQVLEQFQQMHQNRLAGMASLANSGAETAFDVII